ncbi:unnamed protein product [Closterium sp. NIES-53]
MPTLLVLVLLLLGAQRARVVRGQNGAFQIRGLVDESLGRMLERHQYEQEEAAVLQSASSEIPDHPISSHRVPPRQVKLKHKRIQLPSASIQAMASSSDFPFVSGSCGFPDTRADADECMADLAKFPALSARRGSASARKLACLAHNYLRPWMGIPGVTAGMGARGMINPAMLQQMGTMANVLSCAGHVRIVRGKIFFRFGNFEFDWYRLRRFVFSVKLIQDAIREYKLHNLNAEFFLNTCDMYISKASSVAKPLAGLPIFSVHGAPGSIDILYPDPVDLSSNYFREAENETPWEQKESRAVFRGGMTNYKVIYPKHWRGSPRFRVHRMSDVRPDLLDARVVGGVDPEYRAGLRQDSISFGKRLGPTDMQGYKYELDVDGGTGSGRVCGVLSSSQMLIKQASEYTQFFDPLMCPYRHFLPTHRFFSDLFGRIEWARRNDGEARRIVRQANELASDVCTFDGRQLYWAILLAKYSVSALEDNHNITQPPLFTCTAPPTQGDVDGPKSQTRKPPPRWPPRCDSVDAKSQPPCTHYCIGLLEDESKWKWLSVDVLDDIEVYKPRNKHIKFQNM